MRAAICARQSSSRITGYREGWTVEKALDEYYRLDANYWDSLDLVKVLKENAGKPPAPRSPTAPATR